jgi:arsenite-transporting ATPase
MTGSILRSVLLLAPLSISWAFCTPIAHKRSAGTAFIPPVVSRCSSSGGSSSSSSLYSLAPLMDEIAVMVRENDQVKSPSSDDVDTTPVIFVGGKGGVGKTSISSSLAVALASSIEHDLKVLVVSTDPAHSLGDALDVDLRQAESINGKKKPTLLMDPLTNGKLHALEVDPNAALAEFQSNLQLFDVSTLSSSIGMNVPPQLLQDLGLNELHTIIKNPPPGLDELVALANVLDPKNAEEYDVIIVDTAPTGHTLRMLQLPQFLDGFLQTLLKLREKLKGLVQTMQMFLGAQQQSASPQEASQMDVDKALAALESFQKRTSQLRQRLQKSSATKFVVVSIPTILSVRESQRLMKELSEQGVAVSDLVLNQCVGNVNNADELSSEDAAESMKRYYDRRVAGQQRWISELKDACAGVSESVEYRENTGGNNDRNEIVVREVPFYDVELVGPAALGFLGSMTFGNDERFQRLIGFDDDDTQSNNPKVVICGGKGGVGKTTTSSSLAVTMASAGHKVAVVSTDPAHSLGDALDSDLRGGSLVDIPLYGVPPVMVDGGSGDEGSLQALEIDPTSALKEFRNSIDKLIGKNNNDSGNDSELSSTLNSLSELIDTLPAGTDEVVALAKVIQLIRRGEFDRVVLDTAPTGHTLRMLTTPSFLADLIERILVVSRKLNSNAAVKMLLSSAKNKYDLDDAGEAAKNALLKFQVSMYDLEDLFADPASTEFLIVTIGTELAVRESVRLLKDLTFGDPDMPIRVRNVIVNQVLEHSDDNDGNLEAFVTRLAKSQSFSIEEIRRAVDGMSVPPRVTEVSYLDMEPRGVYGLKALSEEYLKEDAKITTA